MEKYDYFQAVSDDVRYYISVNEIAVTHENREEVEKQLNADLLNCASVTGSTSNFYASSTFQAEEYLYHNMALLAEAMSKFIYTWDYMRANSAEAYDLIIRCYLLERAISAVLDEMEK